MRKGYVVVLVAALVGLCFAGPAPAAEFKVSGDFNNRFMLYTDQATMFSGAETIRTPQRVIDKDGREEFWGEVKYRLTVEASTNDGKVKGVYSIELGAMRFGDGSTPIVGTTKGGAFSGDGINIETRFAYTDFQLPGVASKARFQIGLLPFTVNSFLWQETAMGVQFKGTAGPTDLTLAWMRGRENFNNSPDDDLFEDLDAFLARVDLKPMKDINAGLFALYMRRDPGAEADNAAFVSASQYQVKLLPNVEFNLYTLGTDGSATFGNIFFNWDLMYQGGTLTDNSVVERDISAFFAHADVGVNLGKLRLTYTGWYASGDDDNAPGSDIENFMSVDVDRFDSIIFFEGGYTDDNYFTEAPHILDKGLILNKVALDYQASDKLKVGGAVLYLMTAEDIRYTDDAGVLRTEDKLGTEIDAYLSYKLYKDTEFAINVGYLIAGDGMDFFDVAGQRDGSAEDVFRSTARLRYMF